MNFELSVLLIFIKYLLKISEMLEILTYFSEIIVVFEKRNAFSEKQVKIIIKCIVVHSFCVGKGTGES